MVATHTLNTVDAQSEGESRTVSLSMVEFRQSDGSLSPTSHRRSMPVHDGRDGIGGRYRARLVGYRPLAIHIHSGRERVDTAAE